MLSGVTPATEETSQRIHRSRRHSSEPLTVTSFTRKPVSVYLQGRHRGWTCALLSNMQMCSTQVFRPSAM